MVDTGPIVRNSDKSIIRQRSLKVTGVVADKISLQPILEESCSLEQSNPSAMIEFGEEASVSNRSSV
jgi:hypothetical protein